DDQLEWRAGGDLGSHGPVTRASFVPTRGPRDQRIVVLVEWTAWTYATKLRSFSADASLMLLLRRLGVRDAHALPQNDRINIFFAAIQDGVASANRTVPPPKNQNQGPFAAIGREYVGGRAGNSHGTGLGDLGGRRPGRDAMISLEESEEY